MKYNPALDGIRAIAVLAVVAFHAKAPMSGGGWLGVDLFFVLSGYLITTILLSQHQRHGAFRWGEFFRRRLERLYPALAAMLCAYLALAPLMWPNYGWTNHLTDAALGAAYLTSYTQPHFDQPLYLQHLWSLAVEVHYYLVWPVVLALLIRLPSRHQIPVVTILALTASAVRIHALWFSANLDQVYCYSHLRLSGLMTGSLLALVLTRTQIHWLVAQALGVLGLIGFMALHQADLWKTASGLTLGIFGAELAAVGLIVWATGQPHLLSNPLLMWLGRYSYGIYLWHYPVFRWLRVDNPWWLTLAIGFCLAVALAALSYHTVEALFRRRHPSAAARRSIQG